MYDKTPSTLHFLTNMFLKKKMKSLLYVTAGAATVFGGICLYKEDGAFYRNIIMPIIHLLDAETAHNLGIFVSEHRLLPKTKYKDPAVLRVEVLGKVFPNPIGIAAGFDKDGRAIPGLKDMGFGFVEIGSVTPQPQPGNPKPRLFRLTEDGAVINRYGFNSEGHNQVLPRIKYAKNNESVIVGVNLGKNKISVDPVKDYVEGVEKFGPIADYLVINISSPNTPNLRSLQSKENLKMLLQPIISSRDKLGVTKKPLIFLKLAPDLSTEERKDISEVLKQKDCKVDGLIISNTTIHRPSLVSQHKNEIGGLSGEPLRDTSTEMIRELSRLTNGMPIIGVGGITSGKDAYDKIKAGASLIQIYSALVYEGPPIVRKIKAELADLLEQDGHKSINEAVGKNARQ
ncbi:dihydroorotate dehydrogenase (quinone), mitochondrial isoform X2 [Cylas formicarius]|uniref:dihydroorotate dehydrogenase (quinone), mitochondrial isoform X2 n=1 Tax=Cylas formicarius TaxID=197179 RepID=UPI0029588F45|nr:dihydroorotate dehydrogenase (quinone), mitochondrial isoform X2 [Cylas formicarius]